MRKSINCFILLSDIHLQNSTYLIGGLRGSKEHVSHGLRVNYLPIKILCNLEINCLNGDDKILFGNDLFHGGLKKTFLIDDEQETVFRFISKNDRVNIPITLKFCNESYYFEWLKSNFRY